MKFCSKCGNLMTPKKEGGSTIWYCNTCDVSEEMKESNIKLSQRNVGRNERDIVIVKENKEALPITEKECPKCGHGKAYWWTMQTRSSDEPETRFYKCVGCSYTWREYS